MARPHLKHLEQAAKDASNGATPQKKIESLTKAFKLFTLEAEKLEKAYSELKQQFRAANSALEESNHTLKVKLIQLDALTYYLNSILSNMSQGILFIDFNGGVTTYNSAAEKILGLPSGEVLFHNFWSNFKDDIFGFSMRETLSMRTATGTRYATLERSPDERLELEIETTIVVQNGQTKGATIDAMQGMIILIRDITEIRRLQMIANRHDRLQELGEMAAMVAHEIRNPLGGIKGFASLLQRDLNDRPELQKMASYIIEGTDNLNHLMTTVLNYARPVQPEIEWADLVGLAHDLCNHMKVDIQLDPRVKINLKTKKSSLLVPIDISLIRSALFNLMVNAVQAMPEGGQLTLALGTENDCATLSVIDTGSGISPENMKKLYTPFFTTRPEGNGFGLAEVLKIVQAHNATIDVESTVGKGTSFTIKMPLKRKR